MQDAGCVSRPQEFLTKSKFRCLAAQKHPTRRLKEVLLSQSTDMSFLVYTYMYPAEGEHYVGGTCKKLLSASLVIASVMRKCFDPALGACSCQSTEPPSSISRY